MQIRQSLAIDRATIAAPAIRFAIRGTIRRYVLFVTWLAATSTAAAATSADAPLDRDAMTVPSRPLPAKHSSEAPIENGTQSVLIDTVSPKAAAREARRLQPPSLLPSDNLPPPKSAAEEIGPQTSQPSAANQGQESIATLSIDIRTKPKDGQNEVPDSAGRKQFGDQSPVRYGAVRQEDYFAVANGPTSANFCYRPLYFEEVNLERYGRTWGPLQPAVSGTRFFATIPSLPYQMTVYRPHVCYNWNWPYEAGRPAPHVRELPPLRVDAGLVEAGVIAGLIVLFP